MDLAIAVKGRKMLTKTVIEDIPFWKKRRYIVVLMVFFGFFNSYSMRVNLSVAVLAMTEPYNTTLINGTSMSVEKLFDWDSTKRGLVLSSFFYGYVCTQLFGGILATKFKAHFVSLCAPFFFTHFLEVIFFRYLEQEFL